MRNRRKFGEILLESGAIKQQDLDRALQLQSRSGLALGRILEDLGVITDRDIIQILARQFRLPTLDVIPAAPQPGSLLQLIDCHTAIKMMVFPLYQEKGKLYLALTNPLDFSTLDRLAFIVGRPISPVLATANTIMDAIRRFYIGETVTRADSRETILLIGATESATLIRRLEQQGYSAATVADVKDAMLMSLHNVPGLIVADIDLDEGKGVSFLRELQNAELTRRIPVIALSSLTEAKDEARLLGLGYFDFIAKPVNPVLLTSRIKRALRFFCEEKSKIQQPSTAGGMLSVEVANAS